MRLVTYQSSTGPRSAALQGHAYVDLNQADASLPTSLLELLTLGGAGLAGAAKAAQSGKPFGPAGVKLLAPIPRPPKVICIGLNYADHAKESGVAPPTEPVVFSKFSSVVIGPEDPIQLPPHAATVDYEAELVAVIGKGGRDIPRQKAFEHIAGYCCGHDVSARDWQLGKPGGQWLLGKTFDTFAPLGPWLVTRDEVLAPQELPIKLRLNGQTMQDSNTRQLIFGIDQLVAYLSSVCALETGDLIYTGTPPGVGMARKPPIFLKAGDVCEVEIEGLGVLRNPVVRHERTAAEWR